MRQTAHAIWLVDVPVGVQKEHAIGHNKGVSGRAGVGG